MAGVLQAKPLRSGATLRRDHQRHLARSGTKTRQGMTGIKEIEAGSVSDTPGSSRSRLSMSLLESRRKETASSFGNERWSARLRSALGDTETQRWADSEPGS